MKVLSFLGFFLLLCEQTSFVVVIVISEICDDVGFSVHACNSALRISDL